MELELMTAVIIKLPANYFLVKFQCLENVKKKKC